MHNQNFFYSPSREKTSFLTNKEIHKHKEEKNPINCNVVCATNKKIKK